MKNTLFEIRTIYLDEFKLGVIAGTIDEILIQHHDGILEVIISDYKTIRDKDALKKFEDLKLIKAISQVIAYITNIEQFLTNWINC